MKPEELIRQANRMILAAASSSGVSALAEAKEFFRVYAGERTAFLKQLTDVNQTWSDSYIKEFVTDTLQAFTRFVENGLLQGVSLQRKAQIDVVSDFLSQANTLLSSHDVHPAAPTVLIGAALEEFLRNWLEDAGLGLGGRKPSLDAYSTVLREGDLITKQDVKDITSWGGLRNHAAHGEWDQVQDAKRIALMLEGVNLFMRKYSERGA
jgi:hypothetical protein